MHTRLTVIAAAALISATAVSAEPAKAPVHPAIQPQSAAAKVVLASADNVRAPSASSQQPTVTPKRPVVPRVSTCRCGGQDAVELEDQPEE